MEKPVQMHIGNNNQTPFLPKTKNIQFYIRTFLDKSGSARQKRDFLAPFSARRELVNACSRKFNWSVSTLSGP
jgi:hypothetical protein